MTLTTRDRGAIGVLELAILTPVFIAFLLFAVAMGRLGEARAEVDGAARDGARAASIRRDPGAAQADAQSTVLATLATRGVTCNSVDIAVDVGNLVPGGSTAVDVTCHVRLADLTLLAMPGDRAIHARVVAPVDTFQGLGDQP